MKVLIVPGFHEESNSANLYCINELIDAFKSYSDVEIDVAGAVLKKEHAYVSIANPVEFAKKILFWPITHPKAVEECYREIENRLCSDSYDAILVMHWPYDGVLAATRAKKRFPNIQLFLYEIDPITYDIDKQRKSLGRYLYFMRILAEKRTFKYCDKILHMECNRKKYLHKKYDRYRPKFEYLDFPLIHNLNRMESCEKKYEGQEIRLIYTGKLMSHFRSPAYLLNVLAEVEKSVDLRVRFFSSGDCENEISAFSKSHPFIEQHGYVDKDTLQMEIENSDYLLNIGNKLSDMLPSKLLTYMETGMPILHVKNQENDACIPYLEKYKLALIIDENEPVTVSAEKLIEFVKNNYGKRLGSEMIVQTFFKNTPLYSAGRIYEMINP